jgi:thioredoxin reductase
MTSAPDYDVLVVGGGPAGIAAAVRVRWVKRYHVVPAKVAIIEPSTLGGLTQMGTCVMTGPSWMYNSESISPLLMGDVERFHIPHLAGRVARIEKRGSRFLVEVVGVGSLTARAVVLACGMKLLTREPALWNHGVTATSMGIQWSVEKLKSWTSDPGLRRVVFVGSDQLHDLIDFVDRHPTPRPDLRFVLEPISGRPGRGAALSRPDVLSGTVVALHGEARLEAVTVVDGNGGHRRIDEVDLLVVDFMSYELRPARAFSCDGLALDPSGYVIVDRRQHTSIPGLFAAGDVTGMPACVGKALGEGIVAGFEAYRHVFREKFASEPPLFAYYGHEVPLSEGFIEFPPFEDHRHAPELLGPVDLVLEFALERTPVAEQSLIEQVVRTLGAGTDQRPRSLADLAEETALSRGEVRRAVLRLLELKMATLQEHGS